MTEKQSESLRLANALNELDAQFSFPGLCGEAAAELRRLHQSEREGWRHAAELEQERERLTNLCHDYLGELTAMRAVKQMHEQKVRFKCTVIDDQHPNGVPLEQWGNAAQRQWVGLTDESVVSAAARVLSDRVAASCNVDCGDQWMLYGNDFIEDARAALQAAEAKLREKNAA